VPKNEIYNAKKEVMAKTTRPKLLGQNKRRLELAFLTPTFLGGLSAEVCEISPHTCNSDFLYFLKNDGKFALSMVSLF
jgi:hypothetical protein